MRAFVGRHARALVNALGYQVTKMSPNSDTWLFDSLDPLRVNLMEFDPETREFLRFCLANHRISKSQILQDLFVLYTLGRKRQGFFVEFGATDGINLSNSFSLENDYGWSGILSEPAFKWHDDLTRNRQCVIDFDCVSDKTGERVIFNEVLSGLGLSTIDAFTGDDCHSAARQNGNRYEVPTVSLTDLLERYDAPSNFDYLSIDTEGSEYHILSELDFHRYKPKIITVEHNFVDAKRGAIFSLLEREGYIRRFETISMFDDWYVHETVNRH